MLIAQIAGAARRVKNCFVVGGGGLKALNLGCCIIDRIKQVDVAMIPRGTRQDAQFFLGARKRLRQLQSQQHFEFGIGSFPSEFM